MGAAVRAAPSSRGPGLMLIQLAGVNLASGEDVGSTRRRPAEKTSIGGLHRRAPGAVCGRPAIEAADVVRLRATTIVKVGCGALEAGLRRQDPEEVIDVWLFKDKESYDQHTREIFDDQPTTPYGYYSEQASRIDHEHRHGRRDAGA